MAFRHYRLGTPKKGSGAWWQDGRMAVSKTSAASKANWKPTNGSPSIFRRGSERMAIKTNRHRRLVKCQSWRLLQGDWASSHLMLGKLPLIGAVAGILMISTAPSAHMGGGTNPGGQR